MDISVSPLFVPAGEGKVISPIENDRTTYKAYTKDTGGQYALLHQIVPPKHGPRKHFHTLEEEAFYIIEGEFSFEIGDQFIKAKSGDFVLGPRRIPHKFWNSGEKMGQYLLIISPGGLEPFFEEFSLLLKEDPNDYEKQAELAKKYGIYFV